jgi:small neutral amino acid transporter SnatA (MarC family)
MDHRSIDLTLVIDSFLLLLIGIGPKIALVPFLDVTADFDASTKQSMVRKMLKTAGVVAVLLVAVGELLASLLHFSTGSLSIAGGIILVIIAVTMIRRSGGQPRDQGPRSAAGRGVHGRGDELGGRDQQADQ